MIAVNKLQDDINLEICWFFYLETDHGRCGQIEVVHE